MTRINEDHIDVIYDVLTTMRMFSQILADGEITDRIAGEMSWLLGSARRRLEPVASLLEELQNSSPAGDSSSALVDHTAMLTAIQAEKTRRRRQTGEAV